MPPRITHWIHGSDASLSSMAPRKSDPSIPKSTSKKNKSKYNHRTGRGSVDTARPKRSDTRGSDTKVDTKEGTNVSNLDHVDARAMRVQVKKSE